MKRISVFRRAFPLFLFAFVLSPSAALLRAQDTPPNFDGLGSEFNRSDQSPGWLKWCAYRPIMIAGEETTMVGWFHRKPPWDPLSFERLWEVFHTDTIVMPATEVTMHVYVEIDGLDIERLILPDSVVTAIFEVIDAENAQVLANGLTALIDQGQLQLDSLTGRFRHMLSIRGTRSFAFTGTPGHRIFFRGRALTGGLLDTTELRWSLTDFGIGFPDTASVYRFVLSDAAPLPATIGNHVVEVPQRTELPLQCSLEQNYPNPCNPSTTIHFTLPNDSRVKLEVFNVLGERVASLLDKEVKAGVTEIVWDPEVSSGVYFCRIEATTSGIPSGRFTDVKKMVLMR